MKTLLFAFLALALGAGGLLAAGPLGDDPTSDRTVPLTLEPASNTTTGTTETAGDIPGPCDEPEHAADPRCLGGAGTTTRRDDDRREPGEDVRGPCDEPEHANDPRCVGGEEDRRRDNSGPGGSSGPEDGRGSGSSGSGGSDDRSGSNSGPG